MRTYEFLTVIDCILAKKDNVGLNDKATHSLTHSPINKQGQASRGSTLCMYAAGAISYWLYPSTAIVLGPCCVAILFGFFLCRRHTSAISQDVCNGKAV